MTVTLAPLSRRRADSVAVAVLVLLPLLRAGATLLTGRALSPAANLFTSYPWQSLGAPVTPDPVLGDVAQWFHPALLWSGAEIRAARAPLWVPHAYTGAPFFDLYIMWALAPEAAFLTPEGVWSPRPVAFRAGMPAAGAPISLRWAPGPPGEIPLALVVVPRGGDPLARFAWTFRRCWPGSAQAPRLRLSRSIPFGSRRWPP